MIPYNRDALERAKCPALKLIVFDLTTHFTFHNALNEVGSWTKPGNSFTAYFSLFNHFTDKLFPVILPDM